jgi:ubiquinone biosynthesis protein UbiJ
VVPRAELDAFHDAVDTLRDDAARLAARVTRLRAAVSTAAAAAGAGDGGATPGGAR